MTVWHIPEGKRKANPPNCSTTFSNVPVGFTHDKGTRHLSVPQLSRNSLNSTKIRTAPAERKLQVEKIRLLRTKNLKHL